MNLDQVITFLKVYQLGSFQEAANQMYLPQPTISHRITQLEKELSKTLLIRGKGKVRLTEEGKAFLPYARQIIGAIQEGRDAVTSVEMGSTGKLSIGCNNSFANCILPGALDSFITDYPKIALKVHCHAPNILIRLIKQREIQLAITRYASNDRSITYRSLHVAPVDLIVSPQHRFANRTHISLEDILNETFITYQKGSQYRDILDITINQFNRTYVTKFETNNLGLIKHFITKNVGVHLSSNIYMRDEIERKELVQIMIEPNPFPTSQIFIAYLKDELNSIDQLFIKHLESQINEQFSPTSRFKPS